MTIITISQVFKTSMCVQEKIKNKCNFKDTTTKLFKLFAYKLLQFHSYNLNIYIIIIFKLKVF